MTLSIIAYDDEDDLLGAAVTSCVLAAGRRVLHVRPGIGAAVVQAHSEITWGDDILEALAAGMSPDTAIAPHRRAGVQIAAIRRGGTFAAYTGHGCERHAGHATGDSVSAQVNTAQLSDACQRMVGAFETTVAPLAERLVAALAASGGDARGRQSAAVIVTGPGELRGNADEPHVDLRVDDHRDPVEELARLLSLHRAHCRMRQLLEGPAPVNEAEARHLLALHPEDPFLRRASARLL